MPFLYIDIDIGPLLKIRQGLPGGMERALAEARTGLMAATEAHIRKQARLKLKSRREQFDDALRVQPVGNDTFVVVLDGSARWIDEGLQPHELIDDLLKSKKAKQGKNGRYLSVPFHHGPGKGATNTTKEQLAITKAVQSTMKMLKIPFAKIETDAGGAPKYGYLGSFNAKIPIKLQQGPWQGKGAVGQPRQGATGTPFLSGVRVYQKPIPTTDGTLKTGRFLMTFRTVSDKQKGKGMWKHPGLAPTLIMEDAVDFARKEWDSVSDKVLKLVVASIT